MRKLLFQHQGISIRCALALAAHNKWPIFQMDVKSAFLDGDLKEHVYVEQLPGSRFQHVKRWSTGNTKALHGLASSQSLA